MDPKCTQTVVNMNKVRVVIVTSQWRPQTVLYGFNACDVWRWQLSNRLLLFWFLPEKHLDFNDSLVVIIYSDDVLPWIPSSENAAKWPFLSVQNRISTISIKTRQIGSKRTVCMYAWRNLYIHRPMNSLIIVSHFQSFSGSQVTCSNGCLLPLTLAQFSLNWIFW